MKKFFKIALTVFLSATLFFVSSYLYLNDSMKNGEKLTDNTVSNIPYQNNPENCGVLVDFPSAHSILFYLDFEQEILYIINISADYGDSEDYVGYPIDKKCSFDYYTLSLLLDRIGGIDLEYDDGYYRLSGIQICDMLSTEYSDELSYRIICAFCEKVSLTGLSQDDFAFLTSSCNTDLTMPVCLYWSDYMSEMFSNTVFVDQEEQK